MAADSSEEARSSKQVGNEQPDWHALEPGLFRPEKLIALARLCGRRIASICHIAKERYRSSAQASWRFMNCYAYFSSVKTITFDTTGG